MDKNENVEWTKSEKELFDKEIEKWPEEMEILAEEATKKYGIVLENTASNTAFQQYADKCIPWEEYKKEWIK